MRIVKLSEVFIFRLGPNQCKTAWSEFLFTCFSRFLSIYIVVKAHQVKFTTLEFVVYSSEMCIHIIVK